MCTEGECKRICFRLKNAYLPFYTNFADFFRYHIVFRSLLFDGEKGEEGMVVGGNPKTLKFQRFWAARERDGLIGRDLGCGIGAVHLCGRRVNRAENGQEGGKLYYMKIFLAVFV